MTLRRLPRRLALLTTLVAVLMLGAGCDAFTFDIDAPFKAVEGTWRIDEVHTQTFDPDGTVTRDETVRDLGELDFAVKAYSFPELGITIEDEAATAPSAFLSLFRPFERLGEFGALKTYDDGTVGASFSPIDRRFAFHGVGRGNPGGTLITDFSYVATATVEGDALTILYVSTNGAPDTHWMSFRQEVRLTRVR